LSYRGKGKRKEGRAYGSTNTKKSRGWDIIFFVRRGGILVGIKGCIPSWGGGRREKGLSLPHPSDQK